MVVRGKVYVPGDAATTTENVIANSGLVRIGVVADLIQATVLLFLGMALYLLLKHVNENVGQAMVVFVAIATTIICLNMVFQFTALLVATGGTDVAALGPEGTDALVLLLLDIQHYGYLIAQIFTGLWLIPLGYLAYMSGMFPKWLGVLLIVGGVFYLIDLLAWFLVPDVAETISDFVVIVPSVAEISMILYLLIKGVKAPKQAEQTSTST